MENQEEDMPPLISFLAGMTDRTEALKVVQEKRAEIQQELQVLASTLNREAVQERLGHLRQWIEEAFGVDDVYKALGPTGDHPQPTFQSPLYGDAVSRTLSVKPPAIRLKLQPTSPGNVGATNSAVVDETIVPPTHVRRGSKNLSRMNRPQDGGKSVDLKPKVPNQTPIANFWSYVEPFFRGIDENDMKFLDDPAKVFDPTPYTVPPLGKHYVEQWKFAYGYQGSLQSRNRAPSEGIPHRVPTLKERLLAMLVDENLHHISPMDVSEESPTVVTTDHWSPQMVNSDVGNYLGLLNSDEAVVQLNERIRRDLVEAGFLPDDSHTAEQTEDDELCRELRNLQQELRKQTVINNYRKKALARRVLPYVAGQEFWALMGELDKQVEQLYAKLAKSTPSASSTGSKKRKQLTRGKSPIVYGAQASGNAELEEQILKLLEQRDVMLAKVGTAVPSLEECLMPKEADMDLFDPKAEDLLVREAERSGGWMRHIVDALPLTQLTTGSSVSFVMHS